MSSASTIMPEGFLGVISNEEMFDYTFSVYLRGLSVIISA